jgi:hypothetical protein
MAKNACPNCGNTAWATIEADPPLTRCTVCFFTEPAPTRAKPGPKAKAERAPERNKAQQQPERDKAQEDPPKQDTEVKAKAAETGTTKAKADPPRDDPKPTVIGSTTPAKVKT